MVSFPDDATGDALRRFEQNGFDLTKPMEIDFFVAVPSENSGTKVLQEAKKIGFRTSLEKDNKSEEWTCYCTKTLIPKYTELMETEKILSSIAQPHGGSADGFGTFGNA